MANSKGSGPPTRQVMQAQAAIASNLQQRGWAQGQAQSAAARMTTDRMNPQTNSAATPNTIPTPAKNPSTMTNPVVTPTKGGSTPNTFPGGPSHINGNTLTGATKKGKK